MTDIDVRCPGCGYSPMDSVIPEPITMAERRRHPACETREDAIDCFDVILADDGCIFCPECACEFDSVMERFMAPDTTFTEHLREHLLGILGVSVAPVRRLPDWEELQRTEWSSVFEQRMRNRLIVGAFRYGLFREPAKWKYDLVAGLKKKVRLYEATGNTEHLVDIANYALLEFVRPAHQKAHWSAEDDHSHCPAHTRKET